MYHWFQTPKNGSVVLWNWGAALAIYLVMVLGTLAQIEMIAGARPFDMRPLGYSHQYAVELIGALGEEGRALYLLRQIPLDMVYPALLALASSFTLVWLAQYLPKGAGFYRFVALLAFVAALFDYAENLLIVWMLNAGPDLPIWLVNVASLASVAKSITTTLVLTVLLTGLVHLTIARLAK